MKREPFPLQWPEGFPRTMNADRMRSRFGVRGQVSFSQARNEMLVELERLGAANVVLTSDLPVRNDGLPYASSRAGDDPGVSVWFVLPDSEGKLHERVFPCDKWKTHAENMTAIARTVEAMRGMDRWGVGQVVQRAFTGFAALPPGPTGTIPPVPAKKPWREVLGMPVIVEGSVPKVVLLSLAKGLHRELIKDAHPDAGGEAAVAAELNVAMADAEAELS